MTLQSSDNHSTPSYLLRDQTPIEQSRSTRRFECDTSPSLRLNLCHEQLPASTHFRRYLTLIQRLALSILICLKVRQHARKPTVSWLKGSAKRLV